ncbi:MAG: heptaprenyl pyrophosphate synthase subunit A [Staphylococcus sp.]|uniref:heptaprenyl pyrophosphate synthase subunit A n=1 Tax=Staphylococcus sp. TaxID=29387 RepID=UPI003F9678E6
METTLSILEKQIAQRLSGVNHYESIYINRILSQILDSYDIPEEAKLACLTIDTAMRHLDEVSVTLSSKKSILIGDLLSAHSYTLLAKLNDLTFQKKISSAIVEINEIKSSIQNGNITQSRMGDSILKVENRFPIVTIQRYIPDANIQEINHKLIANLKENPPSYLSEYTEIEIQSFSDDIASEII